ncbi:hypothetical protein F4780DRAFT_794369 [Xylariomycetidae sp. FL0641]|nr:hypothetical protein F4780DRAFT_794369 [Xylariomycetidae sp. FL0641]
MKPPTRIALRLAAARPQSSILRPSLALAATNLPPTTPSTPRHLHSTPAAPATVSPIHGSGPPPAAPRPAADTAEARLERRRKQARMLEQAKEMRASSSAKKNSKSSSSPLARKRFWRDVHVREVDDAWEVHLDARPLRRPDAAKSSALRIPRSKPLLAAALALEWDLLASAQQATRQHLIPLTSLVARALDIADDDDAAAGGGAGVRAGIVDMLLRYLDTDSLLCWAPPPRATDAPDAQGRSLRERQQAAADEVVAYLTTRVWPGVAIAPVLDGESLMPRAQDPATRQVVAGWIAGLSPWELAGLERAVLAGKGLLGAARLVVEWSEGFVGAGKGGDGEGKRFGVEEAAKIASIEVDWQIGNWGEVEDSHDVEREDLKRQLGSVVLLVGGTGEKN